MSKDLIKELQDIIAKTRGYVKYLEEEGLDSVSISKGKSVLSSNVAAEEDSGQSQNPKEGLLRLSNDVSKCRKCSQLVKNRNNVVFGAGNARARLVFVGEAPGREEDLQGLPFVGRAGKLLTKIIESIGLDRSKVFICNVLKCRPPENRNPLPDEVRNCEPYLIEQLKIIKPKLICALGTYAAQTLLKTNIPISALRGKFHDYHGVKLIATYHPAYLLRNPNDKRKAWEDMKKIKKELGL